MNDPIRLRAMTCADLPFADSLRERVGWNQTIRDWQHFLALSPNGCFVAEWEGESAGTAITVQFGAELAWIGMLLVHPDYRRRGIGKGLLNWCLGFLKERGVACIKLDATPQGRPLYDQLGFVRQWNLTRWQTPHLPDHGPRSFHQVRPIEGGDWEELVALDKETVGVDRGLLLATLRDGAACALLHRSKGAITGYGMLRDGARASYLGPVAAQSPVVGIRLVQSLLSAAVGRPVFWDIPNVNRAATVLAYQLGFSPQRSLIRMARGTDGTPARPAHYFAIADPALG